MKISKQHLKALHLWLSFIAKALNDSGLTREQILELVVDINWNTVTVKELLYRPILIATTTKTSTTQVTDKELCEVEKQFDHALLKLRIKIDYPSIETLMQQQLDKEIDNNSI
jgi:hypothetical protein